MRAEIEGELKRQGHRSVIMEAAEAFFTNMVYEQSDSLAPVVEKFKLKLQQSPPLPRQVPQQALACWAARQREIAGCNCSPRMQ